MGPVTVRSPPEVLLGTTGSTLTAGDDDLNRSPGLSVEGTVVDQAVSNSRNKDNLLLETLCLHEVTPKKQSGSHTECNNRRPLFFPVYFPRQV